MTNCIDVFIDRRLIKMLLEQTNSLLTALRVELYNACFISKHFSQNN